MKKILFALEGINCCGGGHVASRNLIKRMLHDHYEVGIISDCKPSPEIGDFWKGAAFYQEGDIPYHSVKWLLTGIFRKVMHSRLYPNWIIDPVKRIRRVMLQYDVIVVCGETSVYRKLVSELPSEIYKLQYIHTNYQEWIRRDSGSLFFIGEDHAIYSNYDAVALIGKKNADSFSELFPEIRKKIFSFRNLLNLPEKKVGNIAKGNFIHLVTLARIDDLAAKDGIRMVRIAQRLLKSGCKFVWDIYGGGEGEIYEKIVSMVKTSGISEYFRLHGHADDVWEKIEDPDVFVLLSHYEGLPNVIYESLSAGIPVFSTNVGCIDEQIDNGKTGWLADDDDEMIVMRMTDILCSPFKIVSAKEILKKYHYDNESVYLEHKKLMNI